MSDAGEPVRMEVQSLVVDPRTETPVVLLRRVGGEEVLQIWIGPAEATAIAFELQGYEPNRPLTHDLLASVVESLGARVERVVIHDLEENTFLATTYLEQGDEVIEVDCRPSDGIALALRGGAEIFASEDVLERASVTPPSTDLSDEEKLRQVLESLDPDDLGDYEM